jgi:hypothetical protein
VSLRGPLPFAALAVALLAAGCAPMRTTLGGPEGEQAARFFAGLSTAATFPVAASFSGVAYPLGRDPVPFVAGVKAETPADETVGLYDPFGRGVIYLDNDGRRVQAIPGPEAGLIGFRGAPALSAGAVSMARILSGAPGYLVAGGDAARDADGSWSLSDERQTLYSDPGRAFLAKAEYRFPGLLVTVEYPGRASEAPPGRILLTARWAKITLRRDRE